MLKQIAPALAALVLLAGCGRDTSSVISEKLAEKAVEKAIEKDSGGKTKVDISGQKMTFKSDDGKQVEMDMSGNAKLPAGFPKDFYVFEGVPIKHSMKSEKTFNIMMTVDKKPREVVETYKTKMDEKGWKENTSVDSEGSFMRGYDKGKMKGILQINEAEGKSEVVITIMEEE